MEENMIVIRDPYTFFNFDWPKDVDENLKHEIEFISNRKINESLAENKIKGEIEQLLKYKHGNNIHEHGKQQDE